MGKLEDLKQALDEATRAHQAAVNKEAEARRDATATLNNLNEAQKKFGEFIDQMKNQAPRGSNWGQEVHGYPVTASGERD